jgi:hypothetical protein
VLHGIVLTLYPRLRRGRDGSWANGLCRLQRCASWARNTTEACCSASRLASSRATVGHLRVRKGSYMHCRCALSRCDARPPARRTVALELWSLGDSQMFAQRSGRFGRCDHVPALLLSASEARPRIDGLLGVWRWPGDGAISFVGQSAGARAAKQRGEKRTE